MPRTDQETRGLVAAMDRRKDIPSTALKRNSERIFSHEIPSDVTILAGGTTFSLHKFPLVSKCGYIRKLVSDATRSKISRIEMSDFPGGAEAFELAAMFCYGVDFEISTNNIAMLRCAAEYLEMIEDCAVGNLVSKTEAYLEDVVLMSISTAVVVLSKSEVLAPMAEKVKLISRCIDAVAYIACGNSQFSSSLKSDNGHESLSSSSSYTKSIVEWWAEELTVLRIDTFQRVLMAMQARGFRQYALGPVIMLYAQNALRGLDIFGRWRRRIEPKQEHEKRVILETVVSLLPREKNAMSISFLSMLLRAAIHLETTVACRLDLEKRIGLQLEQGVLDDLLIPSFSLSGNTTFDVDTVQRILANYLEQEIEGSRMGYNTDDDCAYPPSGDMERVGRLMESYLAEVASDPNLEISRFISLAEMIPEQARFNEDGMYRSIDIYLKAHPSLSDMERKTAHPSLSDMERKTVCGLMECQKLSREACAHAAKNDRLPVQIVVQVLYHEQQRIREAVDGSLVGGDSPALSQKTSSHGSAYSKAPVDELSRLRTENHDLKLEVMRMKMQLKENQKPSAKASSAEKPPLPKMSVINSPRASSVEKPPLPKTSFINSVSKKLGRLYPVIRFDSIKPLSGKARTKPPKDRRHSIG